jgi:hypothetical protein
MLSIIQKLPGIQDIVRVERPFQRTMHGEGNASESLFDPRFFRQSDAMLTGNGSAAR